MQKGYKTTEFWLTTITTLLTLVNQGGFIGVPLPVEALAGVIGSVMAYNVSRGIAKVGKK